MLQLIFAANEVTGVGEIESKVENSAAPGEATQARTNAKFAFMLRKDSENKLAKSKDMESEALPSSSLIVRLCLFDK